MKNTENQQYSYRQAIVAGVAGNLMEWYDFAIYGYMVPILSVLFFPSDDPMASIMATFGAFAAGYFARPLGAVIFGYIGDRKGRKAVLTLSIILMGLSTFLIGVLPDASQIGTTAAVLLVLLRMLQGISVGGEYTGSVTFVLEHAPKEKRAFATSWISVGAIFGFLIGSGVGTLIMSTFNEHQLHSWAWRLPFLAGIFISAIGYLIRRHAAEPPAPKRKQLLDTNPAIAAFRDEWRNMLRLMGLALAVNAGFYMMFVYATSFLTEHMHVSVTKAMDINTFNLFILTVLILVSGWVADRIGRKPVLISGLLGMVLFSWPLFWLMHHSYDLYIFLGQLGFAVIFAWIFGTNPAVQGEILPHHVRVSGFSIAYSICLALFGGTTPLIATYLVERTADDFAPVWYLIFLSLISLVAAVLTPETKGRDIFN